MQLKAYTVSAKKSFFYAKLTGSFNKATTVRYFLLLSDLVKVYSTGTFLYVNLLFMLCMQMSNPHVF